MYKYIYKEKCGKMIKTKCRGKVCNRNFGKFSKLFQNKNLKPMAAEMPNLVNITQYSINKIVKSLDSRAR